MRPSRARPDGPLRMAAQRADAYGPLRYLVFYFAGGFPAMMAQTGMTHGRGRMRAASRPSRRDGRSQSPEAEVHIYFLSYIINLVISYQH